MDILRKNQQEMLVIKNTETEMNVSDGIVNRLDMAEESISELEDIMIEISKTKKQR